jgi:flagellar basal-body rod protein FlgG
MDKTLMTASTGLSAQQRFVEIIANNLSNVNTAGFKKTRPEFQDLMYETLRAAGNTQRTGVEALNEIQIGSGTELVATTKQFSQGDLTATNNALDMGINGEGFFVVRRPDNTLFYTRDGSFKLDRNGQIVNNQGLTLDPGFVIPDNATEVKISSEGVIGVYVDGSTELQQIGQLELVRFINPAGLRSMGNNLYMETAASGAPIFEQPGQNNTGEIVQGHVETSNVDLVEEMVNMIVAQRAYELNSKTVKTADDVLNTAVNLKRS